MPLHGAIPNPRDCWTCLQHTQQLSIAGPSTAIDPALFDSFMFDELYAGMGLVAPVAPISLYPELPAEPWATAAQELILPIIISTIWVSKAPAFDL